MRWLLALLLLLAVPAQAAEEVVAGLSQTRVQITTGFDGTEVFVYGAIKRDAPPGDARTDVVVAITGPPERVSLRKKERTFGIWVAGQAVEVDSAPSLYVVASTRPFAEAMSRTDDLRYRVSLENAIRIIDAPAWVEDVDGYRDALIRLRVKQGLYYTSEGGVTLEDGVLFHATLHLPAQLTEGDYKARFFLMRDGKVVDVADESILVRKVGLERFIHTMAMERSWLYGILSITVALAAGWAASAFFRVFFS